MPQKTSSQENAYEFRLALASDLTQAGIVLKKHPELIDHPVYGDSESALHFYSTENQTSIVKWLLDNGANPNGIAEDDFPLHCAAQLGHISICQVLLQAEANPNLVDYIGETALHKASSGGHIEIIELLLKSGADPTIREMCDELPIDQASHRKLEEIKAIFKKHSTSIENKRYINMVDPYLTPKSKPSELPPSPKTANSAPLIGCGVGGCLIPMLLLILSVFLRYSGDAGGILFLPFLCISLGSIGLILGLIYKATKN